MEPTRKGGGSLSRTGRCFNLQEMVTKVAPFETVLETAIDVFRNTFKTNPEIASCAPGRVNLIGEHVDYNDGYVLPIALPMVTIVVGMKNGTDSRATVMTCCEGADEPRDIEFDTTSLEPGLPKWANYVKGVIHHFGTLVPGFNAVIVTNVPIGGGLSSSAALEVATFTFLEAITGQTKSQLSEKALLCQKAEHSFAGMPCGIMDQLIAVMGQENQALFIDCQNLSTTQIPFDCNELTILICNSNVKHELSSSEYPTRRKQCSEALAKMNLESYKDATLDDLDALKGEDDVYMKRARHVITEIKRTREAADALVNRDFVKMGNLMIESHKSLRDDFEVSCKELDILVQAAIDCEGVLGSRMTGGGFGGCTVSLVKKDKVNKVIDAINEVYRKSGNEATFFTCEPSAGARLISLK